MTFLKYKFFDNSDPPGVFIFYVQFLHFLTHTDTDMRSGGFCKLMHWPGLDPGILVKCWVFPHISALLQIRCHFYYTIAMGRIHICKVVFSADPCMLANPVRSHVLDSA